MDNQDKSLKSDQIIIGEFNTKTYQETQDYLKNSEMGKLLGVSHLFEESESVASD